MPEKIVDLHEALEERNDLEAKIREWSFRKAETESLIFRQLVADERVEYLTINWRKLHQDHHKGRL